ncbi:MAG: hypothetical protein ACRDD1_05320, partial [Planctomycetia bacterium]
MPMLKETRPLCRPHSQTDESLPPGYSIWFNVAWRKWQGLFKRLQWVPISSRAQALFAEAFSQ